MFKQMKNWSGEQGRTGVRIGGDVTGLGAWEVQRNMVGVHEFRFRSQYKLRLG